MLNKKRIGRLGLIVSSIAAGAITSAAAAPTYDYCNYISANEEFSTWTMEKEYYGNTSNGRWRLIVDGSEAGGVYITLKGDLREYSQTLGTLYAKEGDGSVYGYNSGVPGQNVHLVGKRSDMLRECKVWGSWSSDVP